MLSLFKGHFQEYDLLHIHIINLDPPLHISNLIVGETLISSKENKYDLTAILEWKVDRM